MEKPAHLQEIVGTDKSNPFFSLCRNVKQPGKLLVYFGMSLLEVVNDDINSPAYKLLLARLYNARVKPQALLKAFPVAYTTLRRWGDALKSGDSEKLISVLAGRQHPRKLTPDILKFTKTRFYAIYPENHYSYSKVICQEILHTFDVTISGESLRPYFGKWIQTLTAEAKTETTNSIPQESGEDPVETKPASSPVVADWISLTDESIAGQHANEALTSTQAENREPAQTHDEMLLCGRSEGANRKQTVDSVEQLMPYKAYCELVDTLRFRDFLDQEKLLSLQRMGNLQAEPKPMQAKLNTVVSSDEGTADQQNRGENNRVSGQVVQEVLLYGCSEDHNRKQVVVPESQIVPAGRGYQFCHHAGIALFSHFLGGLGDEITGRHLIKQWLAAILLGAVNIEQTKLLNYPSLACFLGQTLSNRHQQRQGLTEIAQTSCMDELLKLNGEWVGIQQCSDFYYDPHSKHYTGVNKLLKGWCSRLRFAEKVLHMDFMHMPTGEPVYLSHEDNYQDLRERFFGIAGKFRRLFGFAPAAPLTFVLDRGIYGLDTFKCFLNDTVKNHFITWEKGFRADLHQDIKWSGSMDLCRVKNSSNDLRRYHFRYYEEERWSRDDKIRRIIVQAINPKDRSITVSILCSDSQRCVEEVITLMFDRWIQENDFKYLDVHFGINEITSYAVLSYKDIEKQLQDKQEKSGLYKALEQERIQLKARLKTQLLNDHRAKTVSTERQEKIAALTQQLDKLDETIKQTVKDVSRLQTLIEAGFQKLDTAKKSVMDGLKILARNMFYQLLQPFKEGYDNYRDDHMLFRHLTRSPGLVRDTGDGVEVLLIPQACYPPKVIDIFNSMLEKFNHRQVCVPDGSGRKITIHLLQNNKELFEVSPKTPTAEPDIPSKPKLPMLKKIE